MEAFSLLSKFRKEHINIFCPLSYGDKDYIKKVRATGTQIFGDRFVLLLDFIQFDKYVNLLNTMNIAVMNHDRQQGMGNILTLLYLGKKIYMQPDITSYRCLNRLGATIYDINEIERIDFNDFVAFSDDDGKTNSEMIEATYSKENCIKSWQAIFSGAIKRKNNYPENAHSPQKVLFINHNIYPFEIFATALSTRNHAVGMTKGGWKLRCSSPVQTSRRDIKGSRADRRIHLISGSQQWMNLRPIGPFSGQTGLSEYLRVIEQIIDDFCPQVVHINDYVYMPAQIIEIFSRKKCIVVREICNCEELCHRDYPVISSGLDGCLCTGPENSQKCADCFLTLPVSVSPRIDIRRIVTIHL